MYFLKLKKKKRRTEQPQIERTHRMPKRKTPERLAPIQSAVKLKTIKHNTFKSLENSSSFLNIKSIFKSQLHFYILEAHN